ncbi:MAG: hypothetical protein IH848_08530 [Acidobacteria bacterium]|nr:hypothetical protein [Acidobacteriota bacterium]
MKRVQWIAVGGLVAFAALVLLLMLRNRRAPALPPNATHIWRGADACLVCHDTNGMRPRTSNHPVGRDCLRCHGSAR